jgi:hypothetical protein
MFSRYTFLIFFKDLIEGKTIGFCNTMPRFTPVQSYREYTVKKGLRRENRHPFYYSVITEGETVFFWGGGVVGAD